jgi:hypothetical protein
MNTNKRDALATIAVAAVVVPYVGYVLWDEMPLIKDARGMGVTGIVLGVVAWLALGTSSFGSRVVAVAGGVVSLALGVTAAILETGTASDWFLASFVGSVLALWMYGVWRHIPSFRRRPHGGVRHGHI